MYEFDISPPFNLPSVCTFPPSHSHSLPPSHSDSLPSVYTGRCRSLSWAPIVDYIDQAYQKFLQGESQVDRAVIVDDRVHCCLYFIDPSCHGCGWCERKKWNLNRIKKLVRLREGGEGESMHFWIKVMSASRCSIPPLSLYFPYLFMQAKACGRRGPLCIASQGGCACVCVCMYVCMNMGTCRHEGESQ